MKAHPEIEAIEVFGSAGGHERKGMVMARVTLTNCDTVHQAKMLLGASSRLLAANKQLMSAIEEEYRFVPGRVDDDWIHDTLGSALSDAYFKARAVVEACVA